MLEEDPEELRAQLDVAQDYIESLTDDIESLTDDNKVLRVALRGLVDALPWKDTEQQHTAPVKGHGNRSDIVILRPVDNRLNMLILEAREALGKTVPGEDKE